MEQLIERRRLSPEARRDMIVDAAVRYFAEVGLRVYLDRLNPDWPGLLADRRRPLQDRLTDFYCAYTDAIFTYEWMRIFMFAGLSGDRLNRRYLDHVRDSLLTPVLDEIAAAAPPGAGPDMEDMLNLHGGIVYIGIRRFIYQLPAPVDKTPVIARAVRRFLKGFGRP